MANRFWVGGTGTWDASDTTHWAATSGGAGGQSVPGASDNATFDGSSGGGTVTPNYDMTVNILTMGAFTGTLDFSINNNNPTIALFSGSGAGVRTLKMGNGTWTITGAGTGMGTRWNNSTVTNFTFICGNSTIKYTDSSSTGKEFTGGGLTYYNVWFSGTGTGSFNIVGSNTFNELKDTDSSAHSVIFSSGTTQTIATFTVSGTAGNIITINSSTTGTYSLIKTGGGTISCDYLNIQHSIASPSNTWYAGFNSVNNQSVVTAGSGWIFNVYPFGQGNFAPFM